MTTFATRDFGSDLDQLVDQYVSSRLGELSAQQHDATIDAAMNARAYVQAVISKENARSPGFRMSA